GDEGLRTSPHPSLSLRARVGKKRRRNPDRLKEAKSPALCTTTEFSSELGLSDHSYSLARLRERARVRGSPMSIKVFALMLCALLLAFSVPAQAQQAKIPKIGWLTSRSASAARSQISDLQRGLRALGYLDGKNVTFELRYADNKLD